MTADRDLESMNFFQLLRNLEAGKACFGVDAFPDNEPVRLGQEVRQAFATRDVAHIEPTEDGRPALIRLQNFGLLGPDGPMPLHLTRRVLDRLSQRWFLGEEARMASDRTFVDFCDMIQHRVTTLYYRAWADQQPIVQNDRGNRSKITRMLAALAGIGLRSQEQTDAVSDTIKLRHAPLLARQTLAPDRARQFVGDAIGAPVGIQEFVGGWMPVPAKLQTRIGKRDGYAVLGRSAVAGARWFQRQNRIELEVGPLNQDQYTHLLPSGKQHQCLKDAARFAFTDTLSIDVRLTLKAKAVEKLTPTLDGSRMLGRTLWLPRIQLHDAGDLVMRNVIGNPNQ